MGRWISILSVVIKINIFLTTLPFFALNKPHFPPNHLPAHPCNQNRNYSKSPLLRATPSIFFTHLVIKGNSLSKPSTTLGINSHNFLRPSSRFSHHLPIYALCFMLESQYSKFLIDQNFSLSPESCSQCSHVRYMPFIMYGLYLCIYQTNVMGATNYKIPKLSIKFI